MIATYLATPFTGPEMVPLAALVVALWPWRRA